MGEQIQAQIVVTLNVNGSVSINGPINNKILCYGLLESARKALDDYDPAQAASPPILLPRNFGRHIKADAEEHLGSNDDA